MTTSRKVLVALFVALEVIAALGMLALSVHGPSGLPVAACIYVVGATLATWFVGRRISNNWLVAGIGLALLAMAPGIIALLGQVETMMYTRRVEATRVADVRDELIISAAGNAIGVRVSYTVTVPDRGYFAILPSLAPRDPRASHMRLNAARWTVDGQRDPARFESGKTHAMVVELYPETLMFRRDERCLATVLATTMPDSTPAAPLRVMISDTRYGHVYRGETERLTTGVYDIGALYRGVLAEGLAPCNPG